MIHDGLKCKDWGKPSLLMMSVIFFLHYIGQLAVVQPEGSENWATLAQTHPSITLTGLHVMKRFLYLHFAMLGHMHDSFPLLPSYSLSFLHQAVPWRADRGTPFKLSDFSTSPL